MGKIDFFFSFSFFLFKRIDGNITSQSNHCPSYFDDLFCWLYKASDITVLPCQPETGPLNQLDPATNSAINSDTPVATTMATKVCLWYSNPENIRESLCELSDEFTNRVNLLGLRSRDYKNFESLLNVRNSFLKDPFIIIIILNQS